jgi:hypothetical protein
MKYRMLKRGEIIKAGDMCWHEKYPRWRLILPYTIGKRVGWDSEYNPQPCLKYRRPIKRARRAE